MSYTKSVITVEVLSKEPLRDLIVEVVESGGVVRLQEGFLLDLTDLVSDGEVSVQVTTTILDEEVPPQQIGSILESHGNDPDFFHE